MVEFGIKVGDVETLDKMPCASYFYYNVFPDAELVFHVHTGEWCKTHWQNSKPLPTNETKQRAIFFFPDIFFLSLSLAEANLT